jgi:hypothetical protein
MVAGSRRKTVEVVKNHEGGTRMGIGVPVSKAR